VATHSSGNHGAALAYAATADGRKAHVVMPENAVSSKVDAVRKFGGRVIFCPSTQQDREAGLADLVSEGLVPVHPYDHPDIIAGQGTAALELLTEINGIDTLLAPLGGGGLVSGSSIIARHIDDSIRVIGVEPAGAADAQESFRKGERVSVWTPDTVADGLRALVGHLTFPIIARNLDDILTVSEESILRGMQLVWDMLQTVIEPSSATVIAALTDNPERFSGRRVGVILSGGNIDPEHYPNLGHHERE